MRATLDRWLLGVCGARVLLYANFMVVAACLPVVLVEWRMSATQAGSIISGFTIGYAVSLVVFAWLADHLGARRMVVVSGLLSAASAILFGLLADSYASALVLYTLAGLSQGGVYTPLIMLFADRYDPARRGAAVGWLIASTSVGYALSLVVSGAMLALGGYRAAFLLTGLLPALGAGLLWFALRTTPNRIHPRSGLRLRGILRTNANARRLIAGYTAHSWELLGMWAWIPAFLAASATMAGSTTGAAASFGAYLSAVMHLTGAIAASSMGRLSDRVGRRAVLLALAAASAALSMSIGWLVAWPVYLLLVLALLYGFTALGDSPVLSVAITEVVEPGQLGAVLALRALLGFGAGAIAPLAFGAVLDLAGPGSAPSTMWGLAFTSLGLGGLIAAACAWSVRAGRAPDTDALTDRA